MAIYLKFDTIKGSSTTEGFAEQIELNSFQWGAGLGVSSARGGDRTSSEPSVSEITTTKASDKSTQDLFKALLKGEPVGKGTISFTAASKGEAVAYATLDIEDVIISGFSMSSGGDMPSESVSLNFTKFDLVWTARKDDQTGQPVHLIYDLETNKVNG